MKKILFWLVCLVLVAAAAGVLYFGLANGGQVPVTVTRIRPAEIRPKIGTNGRVEAEKLYELRAPLAGICRRILAHEGDRLKQGQAIIEIDSSSPRAELVAAAAELAAAETDLRDIARGPTAEETDSAEAEISRLRLEVEHARQTLQTNEALLRDNAMTAYDVELSRRELARLQQALDAAVTRRRDLAARYDGQDRRRAETRVAAARNRVAHLEYTIGTLTVRAPAAGTLFQFQLKDGTYLQPGDLVGLFADLDRLRLKALVDEPELGKIEPGAPVAVTWNAMPGRVWSARVTRIPDHVVLQGTRSLAEVLCAFDEPPAGFLPDIHVDVEIRIAAGQTVNALPRDCVFSEGRTQFVWAVRGDRARKVAVETGRSTSSLIEVIRGVSPADRIILPEETPVTEGLKVRIAKERASNESS